MRLRYVLGIAIFCGALSTLGGQKAQAQAPNSVRFVQLLLLEESRKISANAAAIDRRDAQIARLDSATSSGQINRLARLVVRLNNQVVRMITRLQVLSNQAYFTARSLRPANASLVRSALSSLLAVQQLSIRAGVGIGPATPTQ